MRKLVTAALLASMIAGCADSKSAATKEGHAALREKLKAISAAQRDFIPSQAGKGDNELDRKSNIVAYHRDAIGKASAGLKSVIDGVEPTEKVAGLRLIAQTQIGDALAYSRDADSAAAKYTAQSSSLLGYLGATQRDQSLAVSSQSSDSLKTLETLRVDHDSLSKGLKVLEADAAQLRDVEIANAQAKIDKLKVQSDEARVKSADVRQVAFAKEGQEQFDTYKAATALERESQTASTESQKIQIILDVNQSKLKLLDRAIEQQKLLLESQQSQMDSIEKRLAGVNEVREKAKIEAKDSADKMNEQIDVISKALDLQVETPYALAQKSAEAAIATLKDAQRLATLSADKKAVQIELLTAQSFEAYIVTQRIMTSNSYARLLGLIDAAGKKFSLPIGDKATIEAATQRDNQRKAANDASTVIDDALKLAATMTDANAQPTDDAGIQVKSIYDSLTAYKLRIADLSSTPAQ